MQMFSAEPGNWIRVAQARGWPFPGTGIIPMQDYTFGNIWLVMDSYV